MAYSPVTFQKQTETREAVVPTKWIQGKVVFWSNGFNAVQDLKQKVDINNPWPSYPLINLSFLMVSAKFNFQIYFRQVTLALSFKDG